MPGQSEFHMGLECIHATGTLHEDAAAVARRMPEITVQQAPQRLVLDGTIEQRGVLVVDMSRQLTHTHAFATSLDKMVDQVSIEAIVHGVCDAFGGVNVSCTS